MKNSKWIFFASILISLLAPLVLYQVWSFTHWVNALFILGLVMLLVGCVLILVAGQFFTAFLHSWNRFFTTNKEKVIQEIEGTEKGESVSTFNQRFPSSKTFIRLGLSFCLVSLLFSILIVYFFR